MDRRRVEVLGVVAVLAADDAAGGAVDCGWIGETKPLTDDTDAATRATAAYADCNLMIACISACLLLYYGAALLPPRALFMLTLVSSPRFHLDALPHDGQDVFRPIPLRY